MCAQAGDLEALRFLYARYAEDVYGCVRGIVHDDAAAEELTGRVFAELVDAIGAYEEREVSFVAWLMGVARNAATEHIRRDLDLDHA
jgi:RNA polymerase sigma factor (sigma-70 family)